ncbi:hypothetical protein GCM10025738_00150 [Microbacterium fluvii]
MLGNSLARRPWQLVGFCFGVLWALSILALIVVACVAVGAADDPTLSRVVAVVAGSLLLVGWVLAPVLVAGIDTSVDAARLAPFPLSRRQTMVALAGVGATGIPGIVTTLAALAAAALWLHRPAAAIAAVPCALLAVLTCVVAGRLVATLSVGLGASRRASQLVSTIVLVVLIMTGPILTGVMTLLDEAADLGARVQQAAAVLAWTPLGAAWAAPAYVAQGAWVEALATALIAVATLVTVWMLWARALDASLSSPPRQAARTVAPGRLGLFGRMPTGALGATWARSLTGWLRDPRYGRQLLLVPLFPVLFAFTGGIDGPLFGLSAVVVALILVMAGYTDVSYDGTAFASVLSTPARGRDDRLGRLLGAACVGVPSIVLIAVVTAAISGSLARLPALLGAALGVLLAGYAVTAVSSALIASPVAAPGDSPFKTVPGQTFVNGLLVFVVLAAVAVLAAPAGIVSAIALVGGSAGLGWLALAIALVGGVAEIALGVVVGGRAIERTGPDLLMRIKAFPVS